MQLRRLPECDFDAAILQRVKADNRGSAANRKPIGQALKGFVEVFELSIDANSECLKHACRRIDRSPLSGDRTTDDFRQAASGRDRFDPPRLDDLARHAPTMPLFAIFKEQVSEFFRREFIDQVGSRCIGVGIEPHVEWTILRETETAVRPMKLIRREAQVEQYAVNRAELKVVQNIIKFAVSRVDQRNRQPLGCLRRELEHLGVTVQTDHTPAWPDLAREGSRMSARPYGSINDDRAFSRSKPLDDLGEEDGSMDAAQREILGSHGRLVGM